MHFRFLSTIPCQEYISDSWIFKCCPSFAVLTMKSQHFKNCTYAGFSAFFHPSMVHNRKTSILEWIKNCIMWFYSGGSWSFLSFSCALPNLKKFVLFSANSCALSTWLLAIRVVHEYSKVSDHQPKLNNVEHKLKLLLNWT